MLSQKLTINAPNGLHARPVGDLVKLVKSFPGSLVTLATSAKTVKAASMLSVMSLGLKQGSEVEVGVEGGDEASVLAAVVQFINSVKD